MANLSIRTSPWYDIVVGVDPDIEKSGVAVLDVHTHSVEVANLTFPELCRYVFHAASDNKGKRIVVVVEAGWMRGSNWHLSMRESKLSAASKGYDVGRNHETGHKIVEMCRYMGVETMELAPLRKCWKGTDGKITQEEIMQFVPGLPKRMNQDARDAVLLAWCFANLPIRLKC